MNEDIARTLEHRLAELSKEVAEIDQELRSALPADWEEQATQLEGQDALEGIEKQKLKEMQQIRAVLQKIADGQYGICAKCGDDIDPKRLKALPTAIFCVSCVG